jgi:hypothetical protein
MAALPAPAAVYSLVTASTTRAVILSALEAHTGGAPRLSGQRRPPLQPRH